MQAPRISSTFELNLVRPHSSWAQIAIVLDVKHKMLELIDHALNHVALRENGVKLPQRGLRSLEWGRGKNHKAVRSETIHCSHPGHPAYVEHAWDTTS
jgi:hypothetical protein